MAIQINLTLKDIYGKLCPKCKKTLLDIASAEPRCKRDFFDQLGKDLASFRIDGALFPLDGAPF